MKLTCTVMAFVFLAGMGLPDQTATAQEKRIVVTSENKPSRAVREMAAERRAPSFSNLVYVVPNKTRGESTRTIEKAYDGPDPVLQSVIGNAPGVIDVNFDGADNNDNQDQVGFRVAPPDTDGDVGPNHYVQMINLVTTIYDKSGNVLLGPVPTNTFWSGFGGLCETTNQGDPIVLYDELADRWLISQFAFDDGFTTFAQCVAVSQTGDPTGAYNRYAFSFDAIGFPDYPKHGIMGDSYTLMVNVFEPPLFFFSGSGLAALDRDAMIAGQPATMSYFGLGAAEFGFVAGDIDGASVDMNPTFATAMSNSNQFDIWEIDVDWSNPGAATVSQVAAIPVSAFDSDLCAASREACIPSPGGTSYEAIADRLMHRLNIRDFGTHQSMIATHTVDVGSGRAGIRWYELRNTGSGWSLYQEGTFAPDDGLHRWMGSAAINAAGDIAIGYSVSSSTVNPEIRFTGQTAANSGSGELDVDETTIVTSTISQTGTARWGDYSHMAVDPIDDKFWYTTEYTSPNSTTSFHWGTRIASFSFDEGTQPDPPDADPTNLVATASSTSEISLSWDDNASNETSYEIERCSGSGCGDFALVATAGANSSMYTDGGLSTNSTYTYRVRAANSAGVSGYSNVAEATTSDDPVPDADPTNLAAAATSTSDIALSWDDNASNETGYQIERCTGSGCNTWALIATTGADAESYTDSGLASSTTYQYRTRAVNGAGVSGYSNVASATTDDDPNPTDDLVVVVTPESDPFILTSNSGRFEFDLSITNNGSSSVTTDYWSRVVQENGEFRDSRSVVSVTIAAGETFTTTVRERVNRRDPAGTYTVEGLAGDYPDEEASDSFTLIKEDNGPDLAKMGAEVPTELALDQNYPNPFNPSTTIRYGVPEDGIVAVRVYNVMGQEVATLVSEWKGAGVYEVSFDASSFSAGVYLFSVEAGGKQLVNRMTLLK